MNETEMPKPFINICPGYTIKRFLTARRWSREDLARLTDITTNQLSLIIDGKVRITGETAARIGEAFDTSPELWVNLDFRYQQHLQEGIQQK